MNDMFNKLVQIVGTGRGHLDTSDIVREVLTALRDPTLDVTDHRSYQAGDWSRRNVEAYIDAILAD